MKNTPYLVVDASIVLKWQLDDEEHVTEALALRDAWIKKQAVRLLAPTLLIYEVVNGFVTAVMRDRISEDKGLRAVENTVAIGLEFKNPPAETIFELARKHNLAAYDSAYLALAELEGCDLWTGDRQLYDAVKNEIPWVRWIAEYESPSLDTKENSATK